ncbi:MAG TPA: hypothetical protein VIU44_07280, partial [Gaiellaceae bacterium]
MLLDRHGLGGEVDSGELALVAPGKGRARVLQVIGSAKRIENVLEALLLETGARQAFESFSPPAPSLEGRVDLRDLLSFTIDPET